MISVRVCVEEMQPLLCHNTRGSAPPEADRKIKLYFCSDVYGSAPPEQQKPFTSALYCITLDYTAFGTLGAGRGIPLMLRGIIRHSLNLRDLSSILLTYETSLERLILQ